MEKLPMITTIKAILKLLAEYSQIKSELANTAVASAGTKHGYNPYRAELFAKLLQIKATLNLYSEAEISLAKRVENLKAQHKEVVYSKENNLALSKPIQLHEDDFLRTLIFYYLLSKGKHMQAFLSLSLGVVALYLDSVEHQTLKHKPRVTF
jgi:hypothetical protein